MAIVGVDFDNTLVSYDEIIHEVAVQRGLVPPEVDKSKAQIRCHVRQLPGGEIQWQRLQAEVYGPRLPQATLIDGVQSFFEACKQLGCGIYIVSHKTDYARYDETSTNLRTAAMAWMTEHEFFEVNGLGLPPGNVYFEATRQDKIERIGELGCSHFVDDLEETFLEPSFPADVEKILYVSDGTTSSLCGVSFTGTWRQIAGYIF